jgi:hypothetical protein
VGISLANTSALVINAMTLRVRSSPLKYLLFSFTLEISLSLSLSTRDMISLFVCLFVCVIVCRKCM